MSENRSVEQIQEEYKKTLLELGDKDFRKAVLDSQINELRIKLSDLNKAAAAVPAPKAPEAIEPEVVNV